MRSFILFIYTLFLFHSAYSQDTIHIQTTKTYALSARQKLYFFMPASNDKTDSVVVLNSKAYYSLLEDKQACASFMNVYQLYKKRISEGDSKVQALIQGYEVVIQTKDSSYASLLKQYEALNTLTSTSIRQSNETLQICRSSLDSLRISLNTIQQENNVLNQDLKKMKKRHNTQKWSFALIGVSIGILIGVFLA